MVIHRRIRTCYLCFIYTLVFTVSLVLAKQENERDADGGDYIPYPSYQVSKFQAKFSHSTPAALRPIFFNLRRKFINVADCARESGYSMYVSSSNNTTDLAGGKKEKCKYSNKL